MTDVAPSPSVFTVAVKPPPKVPLPGRFEMVGALGAAEAKVTVVCAEEAAL